METESKTVKPRSRKRSEHYVNNKEFSEAVVEYVKSVEAAKEQGIEIPIITDYIGDSIMKIVTGLSRAPNFIRYSYLDEMVMDAVENCLRVICNYDITKETRTGKPNAFSYFTQIAYFAFLRRIAKEKKQHDIKLKIIEQGGASSFAEFEDGDYTGDGIITKMRTRNDLYSTRDPIDEDINEKKRKMHYKKFNKAMAELALPVEVNEREEAPRLVKVVTWRSAQK